MVAVRIAIRTVCLELIALLFLSLYLHLIQGENGQPFTLINKIQTKCELLAIEVGTKLTDEFNHYDEKTEFDARVHNDYSSEYLGFAYWMAHGTWGSHGITAEKQNAIDLHKKGGWTHQTNISSSSYWAFENQWIYMMGDSTVRQIWATFVASFNTNNFERNAKVWTREHCDKQYPHRKERHEKCHLNEVTCHLSGFGTAGKLTYDWKHFPYEDYDEWLFGEDGVWKSDNTTFTDRIPDILTIQIGLHSCYHYLLQNISMIEKHQLDVAILMNAVHSAINRPKFTKTTVIFITSGRYSYKDYHADMCILKFNRIVTKQAHKYGFVVFEREEIERRALYRGHLSETIHLDAPLPQMIGTAFLALVTCLRRNGTQPKINNIF